MAVSNAHPPRQSLLDRLIGDEDQERVASGRAGRGEALRLAREALRRDLEMLLNARQRCRSWAPELTELDSSLVNFGIPDFTAGHFDSLTARERFRRDIELAIRIHEPRLRSVHVELIDPDNVTHRTFQVRVTGILLVDDDRETVQLDSSLDTRTRTFAVEESRNG